MTVCLLSTYYGPGRTPAVDVCHLLWSLLAWPGGQAERRPSGAVAAQGPTAHQA